MIDGATGRILNELQVRKAELEGAYTPGFQPEDDDERGDIDKARPSNNPYSTVAPEGTFFVESDPYGRMSFSRNGDFSFDQNGALRTPNGSNVMGLAANGRGPLEPLRIDPADVAAHRVSQLQIDGQGHVSYVRHGASGDERVVLGTIALARFPAGTHLNAADGVHVTAPAGVNATIGAPGNGGFGNLLVGYGDHGAVDPKKSLEALRDAYMQYEALQTATSASGGNDKTTMDLLK